MPKSVRDDARRKLMTWCLSAVIIVSCWTHHASSILSAKAAHDLSLAVSTNEGKGEGAQGTETSKI